MMDLNLCFCHLSWLFLKNKFSIETRDPLIFKVVRCRREKCKKKSKESEKKCICECSYMNLNCLSLLEYLYGDQDIYLPHGAVESVLQTPRYVSVLQKMVSMI